MRFGIPSILGARFGTLNTGSSSSWQFFKTITIIKPGSDLTDFPMLFSSSFSYLKTEANGGNVKNSNGYDIAFFSDSSLTNMLKFERVSYNASTGEGEFWVKIPTLSSSTNTVIYLAYSNSSISSDQQDKVNVWDSNYQGVWHLEDGTTLGNGTTVSDSTNNGRTGTLGGSTKPSAISGKVDGGASFNGSTAYIDMGNVIDFTNNDFSIEGWYKSTATSGYLIMKASSNSGFYGIYLNNVSSTGRPTLYIQTNDSTWKQIYTNTNYSDGTWHHFTAIRSGTSNPTLTMYIDGVAVNITTQGSGTVTTVTNSGNLQMSNILSFFNGSLDEIRISNTVRSSAWISASYVNQNNPSGFYTIT